MKKVIQKIQQEIDLVEKKKLKTVKKTEILYQQIFKEVF